MYYIKVWKILVRIGDAVIFSKQYVIQKYFISAETMTSRESPVTFTELFLKLFLHLKCSFFLAHKSV